MRRAHPGTIHDARVVTSRDTLKNKAILDTQEHLSRNPHPRHVWIEGGDRIILPLTASGIEVTVQRKRELIREFMDHGKSFD
jgi:hypothetical protein